VTDYDCWHPDHDDVDIEQILGYLRANAAMAKILRTTITRGGSSAIARAASLATALIWIARDPPATKDALARSSTSTFHSQSQSHKVKVSKRSSSPL
jgi:5'-methylthioadenosine phosphorylase